MLFLCLLLKKHNKLNPRIIITLALFSPIILAFERGNNTLSICLFTVMYFYFLEKDNWMKELGYISLACAAAMRIYPILMIFYIFYKAKGKEKIFGFLKALGYCLFIILIPFVFMKGGFSNIGHLLNNFLGFSSTDSSTTTASPNQFILGKNFVIIGGEPYTWISNASLTTLIYYVINTINLALPFLDLSIVISVLTLVSRFSLLILAIVLPIIFNRAECKLEFSILVIAAYMLFPEICNGYCLSLMIVPFVFFLFDFENLSNKDKVFYAICFGIIACPASYAFPVSLQNSLATLLLAIKAVISILSKNIPLMKETKSSPKQA